MTVRSGRLVTGAGAQGLYVWHPGYWGPHVGYYGGVNYGFGYMGIGFVGGEWRGRVFAYNSAVMHVGEGGGWGNRVYVDRTIVERNTIVNDRHVAFSGGPGGINHAPTAQERSYLNDRHMGATAAQTQHMQAAQQNRGAYYNVNHGHPSQVAVSRPLTTTNRGNTEAGRGSVTQYRGVQSQARPMQQQRPQQESRPMQQQRPQEQSRPMQQQRPQQESRPMQQQRPQEQSRPMQQQRPQQQARPAARPAEHPQPRNDSRDKR